MSRLKGVRAARARARRRPDKLAEHALHEIKQTVDDVHSSGRQNIDATVKRRRGALRRFYSKSVKSNALTGSVGYLTRTSRRKAFYARFVHDGTKTATARPFHDQAVFEHELSHSMRMRGALKAVLNSSTSPSALGRTGGR